MTPVQIKTCRLQLDYSQQEFASALGVSFATVNRWENGKAKPQRDRIERIKNLLGDSMRRVDDLLDADSVAEPAPAERLTFEGDAEAVKLVVEAQRLQNGHLFNKAYGLELSRVVPLPHQRIAVYENMLPQNPLRFLLADDAGAGKTIMTGLYIREMINRGRLAKVIICCPAGLTWNWRRELKQFFELDFTIVKGSDFAKGESPFDASKENYLHIMSVDTAASATVRHHLLAQADEAFELVIFDEAHKLAWADPRRPDSITRRYKLAEGLSRKCAHLLLLTATPHMGKPFPYFALWRLLDEKVFSTPEALQELPGEKRSRYFIRRIKEEMVNYEGQPIYKPRLCQTVSFELTPQEMEFYEQASEYLRWSYTTNKAMNKNAASMVVAVLQRRLASSTFAMLESLRRRREKLLNAAQEAEAQGRDPLRLLAEFDTNTADDNEIPEQTGIESDEGLENEALELARPSTVAVLKKELEYLDRVISIGENILEARCEAKFAKLRELIESAELHTEKLLVFTEHRDTLEYLRQRFEALGYTGQIAAIHGGLDVQDREQQRVFFMPIMERKTQGIVPAEGPSARILLATDAAGEGINLQFAWIMVNFDIPWNPARLEQRMGRLHRFGQKKPEVRIFNLVAKGTREGDVLDTLLAKLDEARKDLCSDKVFDVIGQQLQEASLRELLRDALFETAPYSAQRKFENIFATQKLRVAIEAERKNASTYGDVARRLEQLNTEIQVECFNRLLPAYVQKFVEGAAPRLGIELQGDLQETATFNLRDGELWFNAIVTRSRTLAPRYLTVRRDLDAAGIDRETIAFLRPGEPLFDAICDEITKRYRPEVERGAVYCDPECDAPCYLAVYQCQIGERFPQAMPGARRLYNLLDRRLFALRWDRDGSFTMCAPNKILALQPGSRSLVWKAGDLLRDPEDRLAAADRHARMIAESTFLEQTRAALRAACDMRCSDLLRGFDFRAGQLAHDRAELAKKLRMGDGSVTEQLSGIKAQQTAVEDDRAQALLYEQRRPDLADIVVLKRVAAALVIPDHTEDARQTYNKNIEEIAVRIARNFEVDHYRARVFDVSSPHLARGYDLESHRANGEVVAIEVKGRSGRGPVQLTDNEWPTAANIRSAYWLYVVVDCAAEPKLYRVRDPIRLAFNTRQSFTINIGEVVREAETD